ncbi:Uncharacterised protein [Mycobacteroides abscessus subsp. abscessus]|nr:Uncharacterised protein [Mycobacteroides abscessus subsp. abscessus]
MVTTPRTRIGTYTGVFQPATCTSWVEKVSGMIPVSPKPPTATAPTSSPLVASVMGCSSSALPPARCEEMK